MRRRCSSGSTASSLKQGTTMDTNISLVVLRARLLRAARTLSYLVPPARPSFHSAYTFEVQSLVIGHWQTLRMSEKTVSSSSSISRSTIQAIRRMELPDDALLLIYFAVFARQYCWW